MLEEDQVARNLYISAASSGQLPQSQLQKGSLGLVMIRISSVVTDSVLKFIHRSPERKITNVLGRFSSFLSI
jgi:hypothetical protein